MHIFNQLVDELAAILRGAAYYNQWTRNQDGSYWCRPKRQDAPTRAWHAREQAKYPLHPAVRTALTSEHRPYDWHLLVLEWPHISESDSTRIAYTRDEKKGVGDIQTVTALGKYITRHFPTMSAHEVRDLAALYEFGDSCKFVYTMDEMLQCLEDGPVSCMTEDGIEKRCVDGVHRHPYEVYLPKYGWHMAVFTRHDQVCGRALCMKDGDSAGYYVRSYRRNNGYTHSQGDERLDAWLREQGYGKQNSWDTGEKLALHHIDEGNILAPYIDGENQRVGVQGSHLVISRDGDFSCTNLSGIAGDENQTCDDCGARFRDGDGYWVGRHGDYQVCEDCCNSGYKYAYGPRQAERYYLHIDDVVEVDGNYYDKEHIHIHNIVELEDGGYKDMDGCVCVNDEWYVWGDDRVCYAEDTEDYALKMDCWLCAESNNWYTDDTESVYVDGETYHPDCAPEQTTEENTNEEV
jgi:hypothetical protein